MIFGKSRGRLVTSLVLVCISALHPAQAQDDTTMTQSEKAPYSTLYVGTYTGDESRGIYKFRLNHETAELEREGLAAEIKNPSFLALSPNGNYLFCVSEISDFEGKKAGGATSFKIEEDGGLNQLSQAPSGGVGPCYISVTPDGAGVLVANYGSGDAASIKVNAEGKLDQTPAAVAHHTGRSVVPKRQDAPHAHCILPDPSGKWAVAVDLGIDKVISYKLQDGSIDTSTSVENAVHEGAGPRHIAFHPNGKIAYVANELDSTISTMAWDADTGKLTEMKSISTLPADAKDLENFPAEVLVHPSGNFVYLSNRGHNSVATFKVNSSDSSLEPVGHESTRGDFPRGMELHPSGKFLVAANQNTGNIVVYRINEATGTPEFATEIKGVNKAVGLVFRQ